jgi:prepilin-type processing-associated H-X9-DG protein
MKRKIGLFVWQMLILGFAVVLLMAQRWEADAMKRVACGGEMKQLHLSFGMYAKEHGGVFPPMSEGKGAWIYRPSALMPEYWSMNLAAASCTRYQPFRRKYVLFGPGSFELQEGIQFDDTNPDTGYFYFNWAMTSDDMAKTVFELYENMAAPAYEADIRVPSGKGLGKTGIIPRLRLGFADLLGDNVSWPRDSRIPVLMDVISTDTSKHNHRPPGANVVFLDGHVEFIRYPGKFPVTPTVAKLMDEHRVAVKPPEFERH